MDNKREGEVQSFDVRMWNAPGWDRIAETARRLEAEREEARRAHARLPWWRRWFKRCR